MSHNNNYHKPSCDFLISLTLLQPRSSVVGLLNEMISKFEEDPPLSSRTTEDTKDPHDLMAYVSNLKINDGAALYIHS